METYGANRHGCFFLKIWDIPCEDGKSMEIPTPNGGERSGEIMWKRRGNPL
jgi:hypothetical protein